MVLFRLDGISPHSPAGTWRRLTSWQRHADVVPLTRITVLTPPPSDVGTTFVAHSGVGRAGFDDPMEVTVWRPPGEDAAGLCRMEKRGRVVLGWAEIEVVPHHGGTQVIWREDLRVRFLPGFCDPVLAAAGRLMFTRAVNRLLRMP